MNYNLCIELLQKHLFLSTVFRMNLKKTLPADAETVPALRRAVRVLDFVGSESTAPNAADVARHLKIPKSTAHGLISAMLEMNLLSRSSEGILTLGSHLMTWSSGFLAKFDLVGEFQSLLREVPRLTKHTVTLTVLEGRDVIYVACRNSAAPLGFTFRIGMHLPAPYTATGKAMLSTFTTEALQELFMDAWPTPLTVRSVTSLEQFIDEIQRVRARGYSIDDGQIREGMVCVGASVRDFSGNAVAGIAVSLLEQEAHPDTLKRVGEEMCDLAESLSRRLGGPTAR